MKISQYDVSDYFTKLTADMVAGDAPDAFQDSVQYFPGFAAQGQLLDLDPYISSSHYDLSQFSVGVNAWKYTDGKQYGLPLDWAATAALLQRGPAEKGRIHATGHRLAELEPNQRRHVRQDDRAPDRRQERRARRPARVQQERRRRLRHRRAQLRRLHRPEHVGEPDPDDRLDLGQQGGLADADQL